MRAGPLRHRVIVDYPILAQSASGEEVTTWSDEATGSLSLWASVEPLNGREQLIAAQILASVSTRIRLRWSPAANQINATWRVRHGETIYNIGSVVHITLSQRELHLLCDSGKNDG